MSSMAEQAHTLRVLVVGDVIGPSGRDAVARFVPALREELRLDAVIVNGENSADNGMGIVPATAEHLLRFADFLTLGDHAHDHAEIGPTLESETRIIRPANMDPTLPGRGWGILTVGESRLGIINLMGTVFMKPTPESPFAAAERAIAALHEAGAQAIIVDFQAEATSEKQAMGYYLDGRVAAVLGTHTHTTTADLRILPGGTAYISDIGMTGGKHGIIGFAPASWGRVFKITMPGAPTPDQLPPGSRGPVPADHPARLDAVLLEIDPTSGHALRAEHITREEED